MNRPLVSVIIPLYNKEDYVVDTLNSVTKQSYNNIEVIIVDDGSTDRSVLKVKPLLQDKRLKIISQENQGLSGARNTGLSNAKGKYILFHDADDELTENGLSQLVNIIEEQQADVVGGVFLRVVSPEESFPVKRFMFNDFQINFKNNIEAQKKYYDNFSSCNKLFNREFLIKNELKYVPRLHMEDIAFWMQAADKIDNFCQTDVIISKYFVREGSLSSERTEGRLKGLHEIFEITKFWLNNNCINDLQLMRDFALMQGALMFFVNWKLEEYKQQKDMTCLTPVLDIVKDLAADSILAYLNEFTPRPTGWIIALLKVQQYDYASLLMDTTRLSKLIIKHREKKQKFSSLDDFNKFVVENVNIFDNRKRILIFASGDLFNIGGIQRSYSILTDYLVEQGFDIYLIGWKSKDNLGRENLAYPLDKQVKIEFITQAMDFKNFADIQRYVKNFDPGVTLVVNSSQPALFLLSAAKQAGSKVILSLRGATDYCLKYLWPCIKTMQLALYNSDAVHVLMPSYKNLFPDSLQAKMQDIPSQIEPSKKNAQPDKPSKNDRFFVLYSGRFSFEKRVDLLIDAFNLLKDEFLNWDLWLYGNGPLEESLKEKVTKLDLGERVLFGNAKNTDMMYKVYPQVHLMVLPSEQEGCPMALREAMSHAVPVIGYQECSGTNEIIEHGIDGLLVENDSRIERLRDAMQFLMERPEQRKNIGLKAQEKAAHYEPEAINQKWEQLLVDTINGEGRASYKIREKYSEEHKNAVNILNDVIEKKRYKNIYMFDRDQKLFEKYQQEYLVISGHRLFDKEFYLEEYFDVKKKGIDPLLHYISTGWKLGYHPSAEFDNQAYQKIFMQEEDEINPLYHFYIKGCFNGAYPITPETDYFQKWPGRKARKKYCIEDDMDFEIKFYKEINEESNE